MTGTPIDMATWPRAEAFALFRGFQKPQYAVSARIDMTPALRRRAGQAGFPLYLASVHAVGAGLHAVEELGLRIRGAGAVWHRRVRLSPTLLFDDGRLGFGYVDWTPDFAAFAGAARTALDATRAAGRVEPGLEGDDDIAFLSCLPWLDFAALDNPVLGPDDCIPRVSWGKIVGDAQGASMAMSIQVHHALVDGQHVAQFFAAVQAAIDAL